MKENLEISLTTCETYQNESLLNLINSLEKLECYKDKVFTQINNAMSQRVSQLSNIKSRLMRINQIIGTFPGINKRLSLKANRYYPKIHPKEYHPLLGLDIQGGINQKQAEKNPQNINGNISELGKRYPLMFNEKLIDLNASLSMISRVVSEHINLLNFNDKSKQINEICQNSIELRDKDCMGEISPILDYVTSDFTYLKKTKIPKVVGRIGGTEFIHSNTLSESLRKSEMASDKENPQKKKEQKPIDYAPRLLQSKIHDYDPGKGFIQKQMNEINVEVSDTITGLGNVVSVEIDDMQMEEDEKDNENNIDDDDYIFKDDPNLIEDDEDDFDQYDIIDYKKKNKKNKQTQNKTNTNSSNTNTNTNNTSAPSAPKAPSAPSGPSAPLPPGVPPPPPLPIPGANKAPSAPAAPKAPAAPSAPSAPLTVSVGTGPGVPPPPPLTIPLPKASTNPSPPKADDNKPEEPAQPELSREEQILQAMKGLKKTGEVKVAQVEKKELSFMEQLALARSKLKTKVDVPQKEEPKKEEPPNPTEALRKQIQLRYMNLKRDEKSSDSEEESD
ncbi:MAG: hypothetical protein MJ252_21840 [archaeon]|nr:hypothetical protein [archaeon]